VSRQVEPLREVPVRRGDGEGSDWVAIEEPLLIEVDGRSLGVTLRTPGQDRELVAGLLYAEGLVRHAADIASLEEEPTPVGAGAGGAPAGRVVARLAPELAGRRDDPPRVLRITSACGLCGRPTLEDLWQRIPAIAPLDVDDRLLRQLPRRMRERQLLFQRSGGVHGAALFDGDGALQSLAEDVGRHNAVDKVVGAALLADELPLAGRILVVSGRAGFEVVHKAAVAGVPVVVALGAASSLAVEVASLAGMTLLAFAGSGSGNYHLPLRERITVERRP
jgi:FdhD protein